MMEPLVLPSTTVNAHDAQRQPRRTERVVAILPIRALDDGKRRLSERLSAAERRDLIVRLCTAVVQALRDSGAVEIIGVVSRDAATLAWATEQGLTPIEERGAGLNDALASAAEWAHAMGADAELIVLPDLPLLQAEDVRTVVRSDAPERSIVICSDRAWSGTNMLLMRPCGVIPPRFGLDSFNQHIEAARNADVAVRVCDLPRTHWDIDTPADLDEWVIRT
jgi:2-phospho-L-lactate guanylyltransferase